MKLWVDDMRDAPDESWTVVRKLEAAVIAVANFSLEEVSLDHDIENRPDDETFVSLGHVLGLKYQGRKDCPKITIHTINPVGAQRFQAILKSYNLPCIISPYAPTMERLRREYGIE